MGFAIVAIGYNRKNDFARLIESLLRVDYQNDCVDLIMSIDNSGKKEVEEYADSVVWPFGQTRVITFPERQGLKQHILKCGKFLEEYEAIVVLEDDIVVSPAFYNYAKQSVNRYIDDDNIAGISLYSHQWNPYIKLDFIPHSSAFDVYFLQTAQSWGQIWLKRQWNEFVKWYEVQDGFEMTPEIPGQIGNWGKNSWLKYHIKYCIEKNKYFVFPYHSLSTCFSSVGEHSNDETNILQVPMQIDPVFKYRLPEFGNAKAVYYDAFFERQRTLSACLGLDEYNLSVDLYGLKMKQDIKRRYLLSCRVLPYKVTKSFARSLRPHEDNIVMGIEGNDFFLYDTTSSSHQHGMQDVVKQYIYYHKIFADTQTLAKTAHKQFYYQIPKKLNKILKKVKRIGKEE